MMQFQDQIILWLHLQHCHPHPVQIMIKSLGYVQTSTEIIFHFSIFTAAVTDVCFIIAFCNFNSAKWNENDSKKVSLINFPTPNKRHIRFILCTWAPILFESEIFKGVEVLEQIISKWQSLSDWIYWDTLCLVTWGISCAVQKQGSESLE